MTLATVSLCVFGAVFSGTVDDIDLFTGAMCEPPMAGGVVGPTLACLIGRQFADLKAGDRFFYQTTSPEGFTPGEPSVVEGGARRDGSCGGGSGGWGWGGCVAEGRGSVNLSCQFVFLFFFRCQYLLCVAQQ